jgi:integrase
MQELVQKQPKKIKLNSKLKLFEESIKSEETKRVYLVYLNKYLEFPGSKKLIEYDLTDPRKIEEHIINFIISMKKDGKAFTAIHNYVSAICKFYKVIDVILNTDKINQYLAEFRKSKKDRAYTHEEIHTLLDIADERMRAVVLLLSSAGMRVGAIPDLRLRNLDSVESINESNYHSGIHKITVYEGFKDEYITFTTPECSKAINEYLSMRSRYGEKLDKDSFLIREQFDVRDQFAVLKSQQMKPQTITKKLIDLAERSGLRQKEVLQEGSNKKRAEIRKDVPIAHGFRKFFTSQLVEADLKTELRWLLEGHKLKGNDSHYVRVTEKRLQQEYEMAINHLTINEENRLKIENRILKIDKSRIDELELKIQKLERRHGKIR